MRSLIFILMALVLLSGTTSVLAQNVPALRPDQERDMTIDEAVKDFNARALNDPVGKTQPPLTSAEVIASIRGWIVETHPKSDVVYERFRKIAETGIIPRGCYFIYTPGWLNHNGYDYKVWWIELCVVPEKNDENINGVFKYYYRLRAQMISSEPHKETAASKEERETIMDALQKYKKEQGK